MLTALLAALLATGTAACAGTGTDNTPTSETAEQDNASAAESIETVETGQGAENADNTESGETGPTTDTEKQGDAPQSSQTEEQTETSTAPAQQSFEETDKAVWFSQAAGFYTASLEVELKTADGAGEIHYTTDGTIPDETSPVYTEPISIIADSGTFPRTVCVQAVEVYDDGTVSDPVGHHYFVNSNISDRFTTLVFAVSGDPEQLTEEPDGIFYGDNYEDRGRESEREVYLEAYSPEGEQLLAQYAGVRIYGGASRESAVKSMKLFARKAYDTDNGKFKLNVFGTEDADGKVISKYDKLVLRNAGNDFQFAYMRDELGQTLAKAAGFSDYEAVVPAVGYLNGKYYGFYWLHESYCDDYFKKKYGDADGEFVITSGSEQQKWDSSDDEGVYKDEYQTMYDQIKGLDLTQDENYAQVTACIDVENYLDYYAFNLYLSNKDWPQNNYKCYRYEPAEGEEYGTGVFDGRWRYLLHDVDYTFGLYDQRETKANYDTLKQVMKESSDRYAPLFTALMEREDCRQYFVEKMLEYMNGALSTASILETFDELSELRDTELSYYYEYLESLRNNGDDSVWTRSSHLQEYTQQIKNFAASRPDYMAKFLQDDLGVTVTKTDDGQYVLERMQSE
jgi:hypothetical protein